MALGNIHMAGENDLMKAGGGVVCEHKAVCRHIPSYNIKIKQTKETP